MAKDSISIEFPSITGHVSGCSRHQGEDVDFLAHAQWRSLILVDAAGTCLPPLRSQGTLTPLVHLWARLGYSARLLLPIKYGYSPHVVLPGKHDISTRCWFNALSLVSCRFLPFTLLFSTQFLTLSHWTNFADLFLNSQLWNKKKVVNHQ